MVKKGHKFKGIVKTSHFLFPKDFLDKITKDWPYECHLFMDYLKYDIYLYAVG